MEKINLKHKVEQWKLGASMKNMKEFGIFSNQGLKTFYYL
jgi:hypothetical protein